ncbi:response regulator transcription factor [Membranihabitans maritimus]|uniref:response regulator transcription factor n=1 Tax=Membranihabitans maritimus TaxID=2904244 RepID=UPI001F3932AD|nr:response regulator transcription factor [Membranihabitans maritimus]
MKILLIEDEIKVVSSLCKGLSENGFLVEYAYNGNDGYAKILQNDYDIIITDIIMPGMNGFDLVQKSRSLGIKTPIIMITALGDTEDKITGLEVGADDYIVKPFEFNELLARIRALSRRNNELKSNKGILRFEDLEINTNNLEVKRQGQLIELTPKEFALIEYFLLNQGRVISKTEIAEKVWDINFKTQTNVIEVYVSYLRNKIDKPFNNKLIHTLFGSGYILKKD